MSAVFDSDTLKPTERLILLCLADHADDQGRCYPSIRRLSQRTGLSERAVQSNIRKLQDSGYLSIKMNGGQGGANLYIVTATPAADAPLHDMHPRTKCTTPPQQVRHTPAADAPKPSLTINEPSVYIRAQRLPADWVPTEAETEYALSQQLNHDEIGVMANEFSAYWSERNDKGGRKSARGWTATWQGHVRRNAYQFIRSRKNGTSNGRGVGGISKATEIADRAARIVANRTANC